jgi:iron complex transport system permease protein
MSIDEARPTPPTPSGTAPDAATPAPRPPHGRRTFRIGPVSGVLHLRTVLVVALLLLVTAAIGCFSMTQGEYPIPLDELMAALGGRGDDGVLRIVLEWRLPRVVLAVVAGVALGLSGAIFQSLTRNPLGSPDIMGFNSGAFTGALVMGLVVGGGYAATVAGALAGGILTALVVYLLAYRRGLQGFRLIVIGIAVGAVLNALNDFIQLRADLNAAVAAANWSMGSLANLGWSEVLPVSLAVLVLLPLLALVGPRLRLLELGDDSARALGIPLERTRLVLLVLGVALVATITAISGPIVFVALAAPQIARRLTRAPGLPLVPAAAMGAALLLASDVIAQRIIAPAALPVGAVTVTLGGLYLIALLISQAGSRRS